MSTTQAEAYHAEIVQELDEAVKSLDDPNIKWYTTQEAKRMLEI